MLVQVQITPNPNSLKFLPGKNVSSIGPIEITEVNKTNNELIKNFNAIIEALEKEKSNLTIKGDLIKQIFITSSMGVSYRVKLEKSF